MDKLYMKIFKVADVVQEQIVCEVCSSWFIFVKMSSKYRTENNSNAWHCVYQVCRWR